ncbi:TrkA family potassium uptake protein, partial [Candidatus Bipolaricaulota bacterium]|nr:TrkA family potassium uptake protein [Candidatus Bipolaricaulota bacterium]
MIIVGVGEIGRSLIDVASKEANDLVVIEKDRKKAENVSRQFDLDIYTADAASQDLLLEAGADRADALVATTSDDATNLMVMTLGRELSVPSLVSVVNQSAHSKLFRAQGVNVMEHPEDLIAEHLYNAIQRPKIKDFIPLSGEARVFKATVSTDSSILDTTLEQAKNSGILLEGMLIVAIERNEQTLVPSGGTKLKEGDALTIFAKEFLSEDVLSKITG